MKLFRAPRLILGCRAVIKAVQEEKWQSKVRLHTSGMMVYSKRMDVMLIKKLGHMSDIFDVQDARFVGK